MGNLAAWQDAMDSARAFQEVYLDIMQDSEFQGYDRRLMEEIRLIDAKPGGGAVWELDVTPYWANLNGVMHGGAYGVVFDMCTAFGLAEPNIAAGLTRTLNVSYLKSIPGVWMIRASSQIKLTLGMRMYATDTTIRIIADVIHQGKTMALLRGVMQSVDGKTTYATAEHHRVCVPAHPEWVRRWTEKRDELRRRRRQKL